MISIDSDFCASCFRASKTALGKFTDLHYSHKIVDEVLSPIQNTLKKQPIITLDELRKFKLFEIASGKIEEFTKINEGHEFCIIDFWTPREEEIPLYALYIDLTKGRNGFGEYAENLIKLYNTPDINNKIFDTNKIIKRLALFQPVVITLRKNETIINEKELYIKYEVLEKDVNAIEKDYADPRGFTQNLKKIYDDTTSIFPDKVPIKKSNHHMNKLGKLFWELPDAITKDTFKFLCGNIDESPDDRYDNPASAFMTYLFFFRKILPHKNYCEYVYFPATAPVIDKVNKVIYHRWIGGMLFGFKSPTTFNTRINYQNFTQNIIASVNQLYQLFTLKEQETKAIDSAKKSAITQVMARNMSHNIGSHVLAKLSTKESLAGFNPEIEETSTKETLARLYSGIEEIAKLNEYLKLRMDFLADIATTLPTFEVKRSLIDEVLKYLHSDGLSNYYKLLLKHITGNFITVSISLPAECNKRLYANFPNDILGVQAFYVIIENIIRNAAKHSQPPKDRLKIKLKFEHKYPDLLSVIIYDNCNACSKQKNIVAEQNKRINKSLLNKENELRQGSWGTLEMKIAAAYLRKVPPSDIDLPIFNPLDANEINSVVQKVPPLIEAVKVSDDGQHLGYKLHLMAPKELLIIDCRNNQKGLTKKKIDELRKIGIWYEIWREELLNKIHNHQLLVLIFPNNSILKHISDNRKTFPLRKFIVAHHKNISDPSMAFININRIDIPQIIMSKEVNGLLEKLWEAWGKRRYNTKLHLQVWGQGNAGITQTSEIPLISNNRRGLQKAIFFHHKCVDYNKFEKELYFEQYNTCSLLTPLLKQIEDDSIMRSRFAESISANIAIIDERLQDLTKHEFNNVEYSNNRKLKRQEVLEKSKIYILPEKYANLNSSKFTTLIKANIKDWILKRAKESDFLVIHLGILEKLCDTACVDDNEKKKIIKEYINKIQELKPELNIILISGRGKPNILPEETLFLHYSLISQYILENGSKFHLTQLLYSARKQL